MLYTVIIIPGSEAQPLLLLLHWPAHAGAPATAAAAAGCTSSMAARLST